MSTCSAGLCTAANSNLAAACCQMASLTRRVPGLPSRRWRRSAARRPGRGRCSDFASSQGARSQTSYSFAVARITGIALGWTGLTSAFGSQVRNPKTSVVISPSFALRTLVQLVHSPANAIRGHVSSSANQTGTFLPSIVSYSEKEVNGTRQRCSGPSHRFQ